MPHSGLPLREVVSWNISNVAAAFEASGLPLREVVSWNARPIMLSATLAASTSAWGSELKCGNWKIMNRGIQTSTSAWGSELKYWNAERMELRESVYLCVR